jgi:predicted RNase H-like HicB family nuclease
MRRYIAIVHEEGDSAYCVWFPDLPGCYGAGETEDEALASAKKSLMIYAEDASNGGEALPAPCTLQELLKDEAVLDSLNKSNGFLAAIPLVVH